MIAQLNTLERRLIETHRPAELIKPLWEIQMFLGIALHARNGVGDKVAQVERFELAVALDGKRRPPEDIFGPRISAAFVAAFDAASQKKSQTVALRVEPSDAFVSIDGQPWRPASEAVTAKRGFHVVSVAAPGYTSHTSVVRVGEPLSVILERNTSTAIESIASSWLEGLAPSGDSGVAALRAVMASVAADRVVVVERAETSYRARVLDSKALHPESIAPTAALAAEAAIAALEPAAVDISVPVGPIERPSPPIYKRWWFWTGVAAVAVASGVTVVLLTDRTERLEIVAQPLLRF